MAAHFKPSHQEPLELVDFLTILTDPERRKKWLEDISTAQLIEAIIYLSQILSYINNHPEKPVTETIKIKDTQDQVKPASTNELDMLEKIRKQLEEYEGVLDALYVQFLVLTQRYADVLKEVEEVFEAAEHEMMHAAAEYHQEMQVVHRALEDVLHDRERDYFVGNNIPNATHQEETIAIQQLCQALVLKYHAQPGVPILAHEDRIQRLAYILHHRQFSHEDVTRGNHDVDTLVHKVLDVHQRSKANDIIHKMHQHVSVRHEQQTRALERVVDLQQQITQLQQRFKRVPTLRFDNPRCNNEDFEKIVQRLYEAKIINIEKMMATHLNLLLLQPDNIGPRPDDGSRSAFEYNQHTSGGIRPGLGRVQR